LKFSDVVIAVATIVVIFALIAAPLELVFVSALGLEGQILAVFVSFFLSALINGYIFAEKLREARREAITKITVLWTALEYLLGFTVLAAVADWGPEVKETYQGQYGVTLSTEEWVHWEMMYQDINVFLVVGMALVLGFIGLYVGSMLRRPAKSQK